MPGSAVAQQLRNENLLFAPGAKFSYASANYDVLGAVIENVTGKTFTEVIAERLTQPLGNDSRSRWACRRLWQLRGMRLLSTRQAAINWDSANPFCFMRLWPGTMFLPPISIALCLIWKYG